MSDAYFICSDCENPDCDGRSCHLPRFGRFAPAVPPVRFRKRLRKVTPAAPIAEKPANSSFRAWLRAGGNDGAERANREIWEQVAEMLGGRLDTFRERLHAKVVMQDDSIQVVLGATAFNLLKRYGKPT